MIVTVTPNPSIDLLFDAEHLVWDDANRIESPRRRAGGQGINLTRAVHVLGGKSIAVALLGGATGADLKSLLEHEQIRCDVVTIPAETRTFVAVRELASGRSLLLNSKGPVLGESERRRLLQTLDNVCVECAPRWLVCAGSIPRGMGADLYAQVGKRVRARSVAFVADCDGEALEAAVQSGCDLLAPNQHEAGRLVGRTIVSIDDAAHAARSLTRAAPRVLIKLAENGAVLAQGDRCWHAVGNSIAHGSAVGAGDAFLAAFLVADARGEAPEQALRSAVAAGGAVLLSTGADLLCRADYEAQLLRVEVSAL
jgi:1-phosphofructokinase family hexose kinase